MSVKEYREMVKKKPKSKGRGGARVNGGNKHLRRLNTNLNALGYKTVLEFAFHPTRRWRFDLAIPEKKIAVEYEGLFALKSRHTTPKGYTADCDKYNEAQSLGWTVIRVTALNVDTMETKVLAMLMRNK